MKKIKVCIVFGGQSSEHQISNISGTSIIKHINKDKYEVLPVYIDKKGIWYEYKKDINKIDMFKIGEEPKELIKIENVIEYIKSADVVFPVLHGMYGEDGTIQGLLELTGVPYVGCGVLASSVCMDKVYTKIILEKAGITQAKAIMINAVDDKYIYIDDNMNHKEKSLKEIAKVVEDKLGFPVFVKPSNSGSSVGVSRAKNAKEMEKAIKEAKKFDVEILIEEEIKGKEIECAILGNNENVKASTVGQIISADEFYDFDSKYKNQESKIIIPAKIDNKLAQEIRKTAVKAFKAVKGKGLARVDFFVENGTNKVYLNEINTIPGFTSISMYPKLWENSGIEYGKLIDKLIKIAIEQ